jgi:ATP-dependent protease HslVU (ClpYQ) peptidase subunit
MTCIVGVIKDGKVYIGGDALGSNAADFSGSARQDTKVFKSGQFIMGFTTSYRMGQLLAYSFESSRDIREGEDIMSYMVNVFINDVRTCLKTGGYASTDKGQEGGGTFLVGFKGRLFTIYDDYQVAENIDEFASCGCGANYAFGSLFSNRQLDPEARIIQALEAAEHFSVGVKGPFTLINL